MVHCRVYCVIIVHIAFTFKERHVGARATEKFVTIRNVVYSRIFQFCVNFPFFFFLYEIVKLSAKFAQKRRLFDARG